MDEALRELSRYRMEKARKNTEVARSLIEDGYYDYAINRAYYAVFDAMRAVNALDGFDSSKHSGVIAHFNQCHVKTGDFAARCSAIIRRASALREKSDYEDFYEATRQEAKDVLREATEFVAMVDAFLK